MIIDDIPTINDMLVEAGIRPIQQRITWQQESVLEGENNFISRTKEQLRNNKRVAIDRKS